jgi:aldose 1-epimerase
MIHSELRFKVIEEKLGDILSYKLFDKHSGEYVSILPEYGGAINGMALNFKGELIEIMNGYLSEEELKETLHSSFKGSNLFPFPNRIRDGKYTFHDQDHQLNMNFLQENNAIHGLVFNSKFKVVDKEDGQIACTLIVEYSAEPAPGYPFSYLFKVEYKLKEETGFECKIKVANTMDKSIPVGHGWHPYFKAGSETVNVLALEFPADKMVDVDERNIPTGNSKVYNEFNTLKEIGDTKLDNCFEISQNDCQANITLKNTSTGFGYTIWQETGKYKYNFLQVYTPPDRKSIAIEPMTCAPDAFNNKEGLIILAPLERFQASWGISPLKE